MERDRECEQGCGEAATVYAIDPAPGGWGGHYCEACADALGFKVIDRVPPPEHNARVFREDGGGFRVWCDTCGTYLGKYSVYGTAYSEARAHERATGEEVRA